MVLRPKPPNRPSMVLRPNHQTTDTCHHGTSIARAAKSSELPALPARPPSCPGRHGHSRVLAPVDVPSVSHYGLPPGDLVRQSKPHVRPSPLPVHQHGTSSLAFTSPSASGSAARHLHNTNQETRRSTHRSVPVNIAEATVQKK